ATGQGVRVGCPLGRGLPSRRPSGHPSTGHGSSPLVNVRSMHPLKQQRSTPAANFIIVWEEFSAPPEDSRDQPRSGRSRVTRAARGGSIQGGVLTATGPGTRKDGASTGLHPRQPAPPARVPAVGWVRSCRATLKLTSQATLKLTPSEHFAKEGIWTSSTRIRSTCMIRRWTH